MPLKCPSKSVYSSNLFCKGCPFQYHCKCVHFARGSLSNFMENMNILSRPPLGSSWSLCVVCKGCPFQYHWEHVSFARGAMPPPLLHPQPVQTQSPSPKPTPRPSTPCPAQPNPADMPSDVRAGACTTGQGWYFGHFKFFLADRPKQADLANVFFMIAGQSILFGRFGIDPIRRESILFGPNRSYSA